MDTSDQMVVAVGTLAADYAEAGRFDDAVAAAQKGCVPAAMAGDGKLLESNQALLALFLKREPYHEGQINPGRDAATFADENEGATGSGR